jgi:catechol 2,3-dioxygenase
MSTASAPLEIGSVALTVNDLAAVRSFYESVLGLDLLSGTEAWRASASRTGPCWTCARTAPPAGPTRARPGSSTRRSCFPLGKPLGAGSLHAAQRGVRLQGASDHLVSEAIYLSDPEGNGIEVYADKPRAVWPQENGPLRMATERLDLDALARAADGPWQGSPTGPSSAMPISRWATSPRPRPSTAAPSDSR